jgi:glutamate/tyrosine decarboxylase-like PLP-dependent enzyme
MVVTHTTTRTAIHDMLEALNAETGWDVPIHVDAASGGFIGK